MTPAAAPSTPAPMMGEGEEPDQDDATAPTLELSGDMADALTDGKQPGDEFTASVKFRVADAGQGQATLEVLDAVPQDDGAADQSGGAALDSYLASQSAGAKE